MRLLLPLLLLLLPTLARADTLERIRREGVVRWGSDIQGGEPYVSQQSDGTLVGFEADLAMLVARELGVRAERVQSDWSTLLPALDRGTFDIILNGFEITPARHTRVIFSRPYYAFAERLVGRKGDARVRPALSELAGLRVGTLTNSWGWELVRASKADGIPYEGALEPYMDLREHRVDAVLMDDLMADRYGLVNPDLALVGDIAFGEYAIAARKEDGALIRAVDAALGRLFTRGEIERIDRKSKVWNGRQAKLVVDPTPEPAAQEAPASPSFGQGHALLFLKSAGVTLLLSVLAMAIAFPLGLCLTLARAHGPRWAAFVATAYVEIYRGTPVLLQLYLLYFGLAPVLRVSAPAAAILGLGMNYAAYEAEAHRAGLQAVPDGQMLAARALGMPTTTALRRIILPQSLRLALPNVTSDFIALLKDSSLVSVITVVELTKQMTITAVDVGSWLVPGVLSASLYFAMSYPLAWFSRRLEKWRRRS